MRKGKANESDQKIQKGKKRTREENPSKEGAALTANVANIQALPDAVLGIVLSNLDPEPLAVVPYISKQFNRVQSTPSFWKNYSKRHPLVDIDGNDPKKVWLLGKYLKTNNIEEMDYEFLWSWIIKKYSTGNILHAEDADIFQNQELLDKLYNYIRTQYSINSSDSTEKSLNRTILYWAILLNQPEQVMDLIKANAGILVDESGRYNLSDAEASDIVYRLFVWFTFTGHDQVLKILCEAGLFQKQEKRYQALVWNAVSVNRAKVLKVLLEHGGHSNQLDGPDEDTPLMSAAMKGFIECGILLLDNFAQINRQDKRGITALLFAVSAGEVEFAKLLLKRGANCNLTVTASKRNALHAAIKKRNGDLAKQLILRTDNLDAVTSGGTTALYGAVQFELPDVISLLLKMGANKNIGESGNTPLMLALNKGSIPCINALQIEVNAIVNDRGYTLLSYATLRGNEKLIEDLIERGEDVNRPDLDGDTPLHIASAEGKVKAVQVLLKHKANINGLNTDGSTPLRHALDYDQIEIVKLLIKEGADLNLPNKYGTTTLWKAARLGNVPVLELLIEAGAEVATKVAVGLDELLKLKTVKENPPLIAKIQTLFAKNGADSLEMSAIEIAELMGHKEAAELLTSKLHDLEPPFKKLNC